MSRDEMISYVTDYLEKNPNCWLTQDIEEGKFPNPPSITEWDLFLENIEGSIVGKYDNGRYYLLDGYSSSNNDARPEMDKPITTILIKIAKVLGWAVATIAAIATIYQVCVLL